MGSTNGWLNPAPGIPVTRVDLSGSRGNGPFDPSRGRDCKGWILHVNVGNTSVAAFKAGPPTNPYYVTPTIQVYADGSVVQFLPLNVQPWCQIDGNFNYAAAETAGFPDQPETDAQLNSLAYFHAEMHKVMGVPHAIADAPGQKGIGTHQMGGAAWGGHACPGTIRQNQRAEIIRRAQALLNPPAPNLLEQIMALDPNSSDYKTLVANIGKELASQLIDALHFLGGTGNNDNDAGAFTQKELAPLGGVLYRLAERTVPKTPAKP